MNSSRCAACKYLRRRCPSDGIFSPCLPSNYPRRFACVHKIYGLSNVGKILQDLSVSCRAQAAETLYYEAYYRIKDPVYGYAGMVSVLHQQLNIAKLQVARINEEMTKIRNETTGPDYQQQMESTTALPSLSHCYFPSDHGGADALSSTSYSSLPTWLE